MVLVLGLATLAASAEPPESPEPDQRPAGELVEALREGGYVLFVRHAITDRLQVDADRENLADCSRQRNLSAAGRRQAEALGAAFRALRIPVGEVLSSPYCRCLDTARLAFGRAEIHPDLRFTVAADQATTNQLSTALRALLARIPADGRNTVLVSHTGNLKEATGIWPQPEGVVHVFLPLEKEGYRHLGRILPDEWASLVPSGR